VRGKLQRLRAEVRSDHRAFAARIEELRGIDLASESAADGDLARAALAAHHAYCAIESALERLARTIEGSVPEGPDWHQALLDSMALEIPGIRPALVSAESLRLLHRLLAFRHFLRHAYAVPLDRARLERLRDEALELAPLLAADVERADVFLATLAERGE
jgi:hypothetical protein